MRIELRDGQWAELRDRISHGSDKRIRIALHRGRTEDEAYWQVEINTVLVREFLLSWHVLDDTGAAIPLADTDAIDRAPADIIEVLKDAATEAYLAATVPNASTPR